VEGGGALRSLANVILTPHVGSHTVEANRRMAERALQNIVLAEAGAFARMDLVSPVVLKCPRASARPLVIAGAIGWVP
jgi:phosphoglycerate dehydrogenase-like enzyme